MHSVSATRRPYPTRQVEVRWRDDLDVSLSYWPEFGAEGGRERGGYARFAQQRYTIVD